MARSRTFCCCIPVRVAVVVCSFILFAYSLLVSGTSCWVLIESAKRHSDTVAPLTTVQKTALSISAAVYGLMTIMSLLGFIGSITRKLKLVSAFSILVFVLLGLHILLSIFTIYSLFHASACQFQDSNGQLEDCNHVPGTTKAVAIAILVLGTLILSYIAAVIHRYVLQLEDERDERRPVPSYNMDPATHAYYEQEPLKAV